MQQNLIAKSEVEKQYSDLFFQKIIQAFTIHLIKRQSAIIIFQVLEGIISKMLIVLQTPPSKEIQKLVYLMKPDKDCFQQLKQFKELCANRDFIIELGNILNFGIYNFLLEQLKQQPRESDIINSVADYLSIDIRIYNQETQRNIDYQAQGPFILNVYQRDASIGLKRKGNNFYLFGEDQSKPNFYPLLDQQPNIQSIKIKFDLFKKIAHNFGIQLEEEEANQQPLLETLKSIILSNDSQQTILKSKTVVLQIEQDSMIDILSSKRFPADEIPNEYDNPSQQQNQIPVEPKKPKKLPMPKPPKHKMEDRTEIVKIIQNAQANYKMSMSQSQLKSKSQQYVCLNTCMDSIEKNSFLLAAIQYFDTDNAYGLFKESSKFQYEESSISSPQCPVCCARLNIDDLANLFPHLEKTDIAKAFKSQINSESDKQPQPNQGYIEKVIHYKVITASPLIRSDFDIEIQKPKDEMIRKKINLEKNLAKYMKMSLKNLKIKTLNADLQQSIRLLQGFAKLQCSINFYNSQHNRDQLNRAMSSLLRIEFYLEKLIKKLRS